MLQSALEDAYALGRFGECLVLIDTCQAATLIPSVRAVIPIELQKTPPVLARILLNCRKPLPIVRFLRVAALERRAIPMDLTVL